MNRNLTIKALIILSAFIISMMYIMQVPQASTQTQKPQAGVDLTILVSDQQLPDIQGFAPTIVTDSNGLINSITVVSSATKSDDQYAYLQTVLTTGSPQYDVVSMDVIWPAHFAPFLVDLSSTFNSTFLSTLIPAHAQAMQYGGKVIAGPYFYDSGLVLYRKDILDRNGLTIANFTTWKDWLTNLNKILDNPNEIKLNPNLEGYTFQGDAYEGGIVNLVEWMGASGGTFLNAQGKANFAASAGPALTWMKGLIAPIYTSPLNNTKCNCVSNRAELIGDEGSAVTTWLADNAVFQRNWPFSYTNSINDPILNGSKPLQFINGTAYSAAQDPWYANHPNQPRFGVTTLPYNETICGVNNQMGCNTAVLGGAVMGIPKTSTHQAAATFFLKEIAGQKFQLYQAINGTGNSPVLKDIYTQGLLNGTNAEYKNLLYQNVFLHDLPRPVDPNYVEMSQAIQPLYHSAIDGSITIPSALTQMDAAVNSIVTPPVSSSGVSSSGVSSSGVSSSNPSTGSSTGSKTAPSFEIFMLAIGLVTMGYTLKKRKK